MRKSLLVAAVLLAAPFAPAAAQLGIKLGGGATFSSINEAPPGFTEDSDVGYYVGGSVRFGQFLFVEPGVWYQEQAFKLSNGGLEDKIPARSFLIPVMAGVNFNLQVVAIKLDEVEGDEHEPVRLALDRGSKRSEVGAPLLVLNNHLAVDRGGLAAKAQPRRDDRRIAISPVVPVARERPALAVVEHDEGAIAIVLDLVLPI